MYDRFLNRSMNDKSRLDKLSKCVLLQKESVFIVLLIVRNQAKPKQFCILLLRHSLLIIIDTELKVYDGFLSWR